MCVCVGCVCVWGGGCVCVLFCFVLFFFKLYYSRVAVSCGAQIAVAAPTIPTAAYCMQYCECGTLRCSELSMNVA